ncbi:hypothetical protein NQ317_008507, partial [Molorchus minor]
FYYWSSVNNGPLSATIITCSSKVRWSMRLTQNSSTGNTSDKSYEDATSTRDMNTKYITALTGLYILQIVAEEHDTYVHIYMSTEPGGPQTLQNSHHQRLRLLKRQRRKKLTIRWEASLVDPQGTDYCLTVNTEKNYRNLCSAQYDKYGIYQPKSVNQPVIASQTVINWQPLKLEDKIEKAFPLIACVGRKTQYTVSNLKQGETYYFNLFATNRQSNLTYPLGSISSKFDEIRWEAVFRYKVSVSKNSGTPLNIFIMPCGILIYAEVYIKNKIVVSQRRIEKFENMVLETPVVGVRYLIKILAINREDVIRSSGVEILVTSKPTTKIPLPAMPSNTMVEEYQSLRECDSVTVGWLSSPGSKIGHYCIVVREGRIKEAEDYGLPNQCGVEKRMKKYVDFTLKYCRNKAHNLRQYAPPFASVLELSLLGSYHRKNQLPKSRKKLHRSSVSKKSLKERLYHTIYYKSIPQSLAISINVFYKLEKIQSFNTQVL